MNIQSNVFDIWRTEECIDPLDFVWYYLMVASFQPIKSQKQANVSILYAPPEDNTIDEASLFTLRDVKKEMRRIWNENRINQIFSVTGTLQIDVMAFTACMCY